jgi:DNA-binding ferritin-like protein (Dps family)
MIDSYAFYTDKLKGEYLETFKQIEFYCSTIIMDDDLREERLNELLDMFITAQESGKSVKKIIGNDIQWFCKEFCSDIDTKSRIVSFFDKIKIIAIYAFILSSLEMLCLIMDIVNGAKLSIWSSEGFNIGGYIFAFAVITIIDLIFNLIIRYIMRKRKRIPTKLQRRIYYIISFLVYFIVVFLIGFNIFEIKIPVLAILIISTLYLIVYYIFNRYRIKKHKTQKIHFWDMVANEMQNDKNKYKSLIKHYKRINKRRIKKGKECMTHEEFLNKKENSVNATKKTKWVFAVFPVLITAFSFLVTDFESIKDMIIFVSIMLGVEYLVMYFMYKLECVAIKENLRLIAELRKNPEKFEE